MRPENIIRRAGLGLAFAVAATAQLSAAGLPEKGPMTVERVQGIGGFFFKAKDPKALAKWYADNLGVSLTPKDYGQKPWEQMAGPTAFEPFPADSTFFERPSQQFILNFRVGNMDAMVDQLRRAGIKVERDPKTYPNGVFASLHDPEGNPIQLWQQEAGH